MKKIALFILTCSMVLLTSAQINEHSDRTFTITIGGLNPLIQKSQLQLEHTLGKTAQHWSIGENFQYHLGLLNQTEIWSGPKISVFGRYYFKDQNIKHGKDWFIQFKGGTAYLTNPFVDLGDLYLYDGNNLPINDPSGNHIQIMTDNAYWLTYGGGIAFGYKKVSCNGWVMEAFLGYHYWAPPNYFTSEFVDWIEDDNNTFASSNNLDDELDGVQDGINSVWFWTYGFPVDLQFKIGKIIGW